MARRLYLHIGMMKSGTTYIQRICNANAVELERTGIRWALGSYARQAAAIGEFRRAKRTMPGMEGWWRRLQKEVRTRDGDVLMSFELIADLDEEQIARFVAALDAVEIHVIVTARDLSRVLPSLWQESTQNRGVQRWTEYVDAASDAAVNPALHRNIELHIDYAAALRRWSTSVPVSQLHLVTVPPSSADPDELWHRFSSVIGADRGLASPSKSNVTIGAVSSELMIRMNSRVQDADWPTYRLGFKHGLAKRALTKRAAAEPRVRFPEDRWEWVESRSSQMTREVLELGPDIVGNLDDLTPRRSSSGVDPAWSPSDAELLAAARRGVAVLGRQLARLGDPPAPLPLGRAQGSESERLATALEALEERGRRLGQLRVGQWIEKHGSQAPRSWAQRLVDRGGHQVDQARKVAGRMRAGLRRSGRHE